MTVKSPTRLETAKMRDDLMQQVMRRYDDGEWWRFTINLLLVAGGGVLTGLGRLTEFGVTAQNWMSGIGLITVFIGAGLVAIFDRKRADLTHAAKKAIEDCDAFHDEKDELVSRIDAAAMLDERRRFLLRAVQNMQEAVERMPHGTSLVTVIEAMLDSGSSDLEGACGFEAGEKWTFSIFQRQKETQKPNSHWVMRRIAVSWADRLREKAGEPRYWKKKEGFTGVSWQADDEVIVANIRTDPVADRYPVPARNFRDDDSDRYVSVAVIPIRVGTSDEMWGSVTATSDRPNRWIRAASDPREQNVMVVRLIAQLIAMQVALRDGNPMNGVQK